MAADKGGELAVAYVHIVPSFKGGVKAISKELNDALNPSQVGAVSGSKLHQGLARGFSSAGGALKNAVSAMGNALKTGAGAIGLAAGAKLASGFSGGIRRLDTMNQFPKVMKSLGISADESKQAITALSEGLKGLPTPLDSAALGVQRFVSKNGDVKQSTEMFLALNNAILAGGAPAEIQASALEQLSQSYAKGRMDMLEWRAVQSAMPAQLKQVATAMGVSTDELGEGLRTGKISMDEFIAKITELNATGTDGFASFAEQAKNATGGISTSMANISTAISRGWANLLGAFGQERIASILSTIANAINTGFSALEPAFAKAGQLFDSFSGFISNFSGASAGLSPILGVLTGAFATFASGGVGALLSQLPLVGPLLSPLTGMLGGLGGPIGIAAGAIVGLVATCQPLQDALMGLMNSVGQALAPAFDSLQSTFSSLWPALSQLAEVLGGALGTAIQSLTPFISTLAGAFGQIASAILGGLMQAFTALAPILTPILQIFGGIASVLGAVLQPVISLIADYISNILIGAFEGLSAVLNLVAPLFEMAGQGWQALGEIFSTVGNIITEWVGNLGTLFSGFLDSAINTFAEIGSNIMSSISNFVSSGWSSITSFVSNVINGFTNMCSEVINGVSNWVSDLISKAGDLASNFISKITDLASSVWNSISNMCSNAVSTVTGFIGSFVSAGGDIIHGLINGISNGAHQVIEKIKDICRRAWNAVKNFFGIHSPSRKMAWVGDMLTQGWEQGLDKGAGAVTDKVDEISDGILESAVTDVPVNMNLKSNSAAFSSNQARPIQIRIDNFVNNDTSADAETFFKLVNQKLTRERVVYA